jgi:hypothetical protein
MEGVSPPGKARRKFTKNYNDAKETFKNHYKLKESLKKNPKVLVCWNNSTMKDYS